MVGVLLSAESSRKPGTHSGDIIIAQCISRFSSGERLSSGQTSSRVDSGALGSQVACHTSPTEELLQ